jgi:hypothetical protein
VSPYHHELGRAVGLKHDAVESMVCFEQVLDQDLRRGKLANFIFVTPRVN